MHYLSSDQKSFQPQTPVLSDQEDETQQQAQPLQLLYISPNLFTKLWSETKKTLIAISKSTNVTPFSVYQEIENLYSMHFQSLKIKGKINFKNFQTALENFPLKKEFLSKIPLIADIALKIESEFVDYLPMLTDQVVITRRQCSILIANMFLCTTHLQPDYKLLPPVFLMAKLFNVSSEDRDQNNSKIQKIRCLFYYFLHVFSNDFKPTEKITFTRTKTQIQMQERNLCEFIYCEYGQMENVADAYIVDFANKRIGGGVLNLGCVQEEILFLTHPETLVTLLITTEIKKDESIKIENVRRIIDYSGYKEKFECKGTLKHQRNINLICIDAGDYNGNQHRQYDDIMRDLTKAYCGFKGINKICTGKWGCGVFGGEWQLKALLQWLAASYGGCQQIIFINDEQYKFNQAFNLLQQFTTGQLWKFIQLYCHNKNELIHQNAIDYILNSQF